MKAVIMAGGEGTRLRPLTCNRPKPMVPVVNKPVMEHILNLLKKHGFYDVAVTLQYMPEQIKEYFQNGKGYGINIKYYTEQIPLGTAGSVKNAEEFLDESFLVISGDALTDIDLSKAVDFHFSKGSIVTVVIKKIDVPLEYGVVVTDNSGRIIRFLEKPSWGEVFSDTVNTGIYVLSPEIFKYFDKNENFDFSKDLFPILLREGRPMYGFVTEDYWCDIGDLKAYAQANIDALEGRVKIEIPGKETSKGIWVGEGVNIEPKAVLSAPCIIGGGTRVKNGVSVGSYSVIGEDNILDENCSIKRSIIWKNCTVGKSVQLRGSIISSKVHIKNNSSVFENSVVGDNTVIKENAVIKPNIKIWPNKLIDTGTEVNSNMVWGTRYSKTIFGNRGISGEINVNITPEYAAKLAAAYGSMYRGKTVIGLSCDGTASAGMIKTSFAAGLLSAGIEVIDFGKILLPVVRSAVRIYGLDGGIHISTSTDNKAMLFIDFLDKNGSNIERGMERKIENAFIREDFKRCEAEQIKPVKAINDYTSFYLRNIINSMKVKKHDYRILLNSRSAFISDILSTLLSDIGCDVEITDLRLMNIKTRKESKTSSDVGFFTSSVKMGGFDLGVSIEDTSEKMMLVDDKGRIITEDIFIALISLILFKSLKGAPVVVPVTASQVIEKIAGENNGSVIRSKSSAQDIMREIFACEVKENILEQFTMHFDAIAGLIKILDFMSVNKYKLSTLVDMIPEFHINREEVECPWNAKGKVIRELTQEKRCSRIETIEGVKVYKDNGWVLVIPDAEKPVFNVISESYSAEFAEELSSIYINKIKEISRG
jgi:mannose-1-phosphate guanylyltransferase/phosphomannomutase